MKQFNAILINLILVLFLSFSSVKAQVTSFSANGHTIYHLKPATVSTNGSRAIVSAAYDGTVLCHTQTGLLLWKAKPSGGFPFCLAVGDIDGDKLDETFVASSDGNLYAFDNNGKLIWKFSGSAPLYHVEVTESPSGSPLVLTGGVERVLYALSSTGKLVGEHQTDGVIRLIGSGNILGDGQNYAAVATAKIGLAGHYTLRLHKLPGLDVIWEKQMSQRKDNYGRFYSIQVFDLDNDGKDEMVFGMTHGSSGEVTIFDYQGNKRILPTCTQIRQRPYKMNFVSHIKSPTIKDEFFLNLSGNELLVFENDGSCRNMLTGPYAFAGTAFDPLTNTYWLGSGISGGDDIYSIQLDKPGWEEAFEKIKPVGKMAQLENNMKVLLKQVESFEAPPYQKAASKPLVTVEETPEEISVRYVKPYQFKNIQFASFYRFIEHYDPGIEDPDMRAEWEGFHSGKVVTQDFILGFAEEREKAGENFFLFAGHGRSFGLDFYANPETYFKLLKIAPKTLQGFVFAEMESTDDYLEKAVNNQLIPLADSCFKYGKKKILLRNKNVFWNASIHLDMFKILSSEPKYREIFVPGMEETNSRNQSLSLAGRTGVWMTGTFNEMSGRAVTDNANYNRLWEWGQTQHLSHFIRALSLNRMLGADIFQINVYSDNETEMLPFYLMLEKGILPLVKPEDILSVSDLTIGIKDPDKDFLEHGQNGHGMNRYKAGTEEFVFDRLDCYWGGAPLADHDFENYAMNAKRRMTNFIAQSPYGNLTTVSAETELSKFPQFKKMIVTDGKYWYDKHGQKQTASAYKPVVLSALEEAAGRLPIRVFGEVAWVAVRIDPKHLRLVLIDPGYLDPADREAEVVLQHLKIKSIKDILSGEILSVKNGKVKLDVPLGILRVFDIEEL